ncbi:MAG: MarR family winged helix-turn-helix transcriptional regulator [Rhodoglobus sp.]
MPNTGNEDIAGLSTHRATQVLRDIITANEDFSARMAAELRVNPTDLNAIAHLMSDGSLSPTKLARRLNMSTAAVTSVVDRLEAAGHAQRKQNPTDRRAVVVVLNPASIAQALAVLTPLISGIDKVFTSFSLADQSIITNYLERVVSVYQSPSPL